MPSQGQQNVPPSGEGRLTNDLKRLKFIIGCEAWGNKPKKSS